MLNTTSGLGHFRQFARLASRLAVFAAACGLSAAKSAQARWSTDIVPALAQASTKTAAEPPAEGGSWPILDWLIVAVLICAAIYAICRSSRRN
jgi:hypothetical protein